MGNRLRERHIYLIGTGHHYQFGHGVRFGGFECKRENEFEFERVIAEAVNAYDVDLIGEEMSLEALQELKLSTTVTARVAETMRIRHLYCDPDRSERALLNILDENAIKLQGTLNGDPYFDLVKEQQIHSRRREGEWIRRIEEQNYHTALFVCGSDHVESFATITASMEWRVLVLHDNWRAVGDGT